MKKILITLILIALNIALLAQNNDNKNSPIVFNQYFKDTTLRIHYWHIGNAHFERFKLNSYHAGAGWYGTHASLIEPNRYGDILFEAFDFATNRLIYSRSYSSLFMEYSTTERAKTDTGSFEEVIILPMPKRKIRYTFTTCSRSNESQLQYENYYDPATEKPQPFEKQHKTSDLHIGGDAKQSLDILFIPEGYAKRNRKELRTDMKRFADYIIRCSPYKECADKINIRAIEAFSKESGVTNPNEGVFKKTLLNCSYNVLDLDRYLMCLNVWKLHEIADDAPYDILVIIVNSSKYGGGGIYNYYCTVNNEGQHSDYVVVHELGHLLGGLADEYYSSEVSVQDFYPPNVEPKEPNLTTLVDFASKWQSMLKPNVPVPTPMTLEFQNELGVFEGGGYVKHGVYRPWRNCTMKEIIYNHFCPVCTKVIREVIDYYAE
jgi:hypothetical protein